MIPQRWLIRSTLSLQKKVENAYWIRDALTELMHAPVKNCSLDVNVARQSDSLTENAYEYDRFQFSTETTNCIDDCD